MFYSQGQQPPFHITNMEYDSANKNDSKFRKKNLINQVNYPNHESNKKLVSEIYKSSQHDLKKRFQNSASKQRVNTKESMNRSQSKNRKNSISRQSTKELKKGAGSISARKLIYPTNEWALTNNAGNSVNTSNSHSKFPSRSTSASNLKKRSLSTNGLNGGAAIGVTPVPPRRYDKIVEKRPIESISKYGSSDMNNKKGTSTAMLEHQRRAVSIK